MDTRAAGLAALIALCAVALACRRVEPAAGRPADPAVGRELGAFAFDDAGGRRTEWSPRAGLRTASGEVLTPDALVIHVFQPDCPACREQARALGKLTRDPDRTAILGIAHRLSASQVQVFSRETGAGYPLLIGTGSTWVDHWSRGDPMYIVDRRGGIAYAQVGFHPSDVERWRAVLDDLAAGRAARYSGPDRDEIAAGERLPQIDLPLVDGQASARLGLDEHGALVVQKGNERRQYRAAIGFFTRY